MIHLSSPKSSPCSPDFLYRRNIFEGALAMFGELADASTTTSTRPTASEAARLTTTFTFGLVVVTFTGFVLALATLTFPVLSFFAGFLLGRSFVRRVVVAGTLGLGRRVSVVVVVI